MLDKWLLLLTLLTVLRLQKEVSNLSTKQKSSLSSHLLLPQKETEICSRDKNDSTAPSWCSSLLFRSLCLYWDDTGESINTKAKGSAAQTSPAAPLVFMFHRHFTPFLCPSFWWSSVFLRCVFPAQIPPTPLFVSVKIKWTKTNSIKLQASEARSYFSWRRNVSGAETCVHCTPEWKGGRTWV